MNNSSLVHWSCGAFWGSREEDPKSGAQRLARMLGAVPASSYLPRTWGWIERKPPRFAAFHAFVDLQPELEQQLASGVIRDARGDVWSGMGYSAEICDALDGNASVRLRVGGYGLAAHNSCKIELTHRAPALDLEAARAILRALVDAWSPEHADVFTSALGELLDYPKKTWSIGWLTYLPRPTSSLPALPQSVMVEPFGEGGSLVILTQDRFDAENSRHVDVAMRTFEILESAGALDRKQG